MEKTTEKGIRTEGVSGRSCCDTGKGPDRQGPDETHAEPGHVHHHPVRESSDGRAATFFLRYWKPLLSFFLLITGLLLDYLPVQPWFTGPVRIVWYLAAYLPVGVPVLRQGIHHLRRGEIFTEFFLMGIATIGAFLIGEYPEGVAVMLFYSVGEAFQHNAVHRARENIRALLDVRPEVAHVMRGDAFVSLHPGEIGTGEIIQVKPGERVPLDGILMTTRAVFDTSALTGESKPRQYNRDEKVLAGMISLNRLVEVMVTSSYENSSIARILDLVQNASLRKAKTELFIRSFARIYTPAVVAMASLLVVLPAFFVTPYLFQEWLYRGLVFLVISCPCALVISIPLGYFGGIGAASRNGILVKGSNFLDVLKSVDTVVFDKTGTLTKGVFQVKEIHSNGVSEEELLALLMAVEKSSTHPVAKAVMEYGERHGIPSNGEGTQRNVTEQVELPGSGVTSLVDGRRVVAGNRRLMEREKVSLHAEPADTSGSVVHVAVDGVHAGYLTIADQTKADAALAVSGLRRLGIRQLIMLSGDRESVVRKLGEELNFDRVYAELLPEEKAERLEQLKREFPGPVAFAGDGINDAPVLALSDVGIAMGGMGSDVAVETADVVIQTDQPSKIAAAIRIGRVTRTIVWQNISLAMGVKLLVLGLGAVGMATLWGAVFADVGVALLAILNAIRIQNMDFHQ